KVIPESEITFTKPDNNSHLKNNIEESDAKNPEENNKPDVPQKITVGDRFRHKITGNISEVVSLTGAFPWIADECTVTRDSGAFSVTENISYNQLLNSDLYEYIDHTDRTVEQAKKSMKSDMKIENFKITGDFIIEGGAKSKFKANSEAIRTLKMIEKENRPATPEEQVILSRYVGWGGLSAAFDSKNEQWSAEYSELKSLLTDEEYNAARASVLDSFYTPPFIIESIYSALENMGFHGGSVLDPSTGTGNFLGKMPGSMSDNSRIYAVEKDSVSGRIAKLLYPDADIQITGFEKRDFSDNFFDVAVGNIPFGGFKISDRRYDKYNFAVHDYFIAKTLDKVRPGGVIAFITSSGTLDKNNPSVRKYISQRAELLGAVRLPNNAFKSYAGTEVTSDIIFLRKREKMIDIAPDWVYTSKNPDGLTINNYFIENPEMILGKVVEGNKLYGKGTMVVPFENSDLKVILNEAVKKIKGNYTAEKSVIAKPSGKKKDKFKPEILPADPTVKNFSYAEIDGKIFYRENSIMTEMPFTGKRYERVSGIAAITKCVRELLNMQLEGYSDEAIISKRTELNQLYDDFTKKNGLLNDKTNRDIFREDVSLPLVLSLEKVKDGKLIGKADIFTKRTLQPPVRITHADTAADALAVSISEKAGVNLDFMSELMDGKEKSEIISDLKGVIFLNPETSAWETADAYLSGNIRNKLAAAKSAAESNPDFTENVSALEAAMPDRIEAGDISAKLGSPWIDDKYIQEFMYELFETPKFSRNLGIDNNYIGIQHNPATAKWNVMNKSLDKDNIKSNTAYGTSRKSGYSIFEDSLNMIDTTVYDPVYNPEKDKTEYVINHDETLLARQKHELIENAFREWIFKNPERREYLVEKYNVLYNSIRPREYDGSHLTFAGMNPEITLKKHQKDAVAHALYGGNTLFAHKVGAGKTYEMIAAAMEGKRLGLHNKSLLAVPNHMTEQFANDFLTLYPNANILIAHEDDFKKENRQKLCAKIATGEFDAIIIGHSQLIKIPVSKEREEQFIKDQINELINDIAEMKEQNAESFTVKDMERTKRDYEAKLKKLIEKPIKDDVVTFEEMGVDKLFIDEADMFKNLSVSTKMRNISGVAANRKVQKTQDLYIKCQYLDELTGGKGIVFATGTPVSNSITELFIMQKYLQADYLRESGLTHFDAWAANFAQKVTKLEYAPTGKGFRQKTRLSKFSNLPELMTAFKECADIKTAQDLNLPEPECERHIIAAEPTETQKNLIQSLSERAEKIHNKQVTPDVDNMLKVTTDGIKIGL
ncbi:MAG: helicase SNF2, partial [Oscillospiraceae bacterium]|nr:helicase SNF2 [Oscillospiraceae bacterium]